MSQGRRVRERAARWGAVVVVFAAAWALVPGAAQVAADERAPAELPSDAAGILDPGYVGAAVCARCHAEEAALWSTSSHARTFLPVGPHNLPADVLAGASVDHPPGRTTWRKEGDRWLARTVGPDGQLTDYHLTHAVGRMRVQMFVTTLPDGRRQVLPAMLEVPTGAWFDYTHLLFGAPGLDWDEAPIVNPGDASFWTGTTRSWDSSCVRCHSSGSRPVEGAPVAEGRRTIERSLGTDCEMCHGPGAEHVAWHEAKEAGRPLPRPDDPVLRLAGLATDRALSACLQCHMEADLVTRSFRPGDDVFEHVDPTLIIDPERVDPLGRVTELIYDGLPFSVSRCAIEGELTCFTCHDPHGSPHASQLRLPPGDPRACTVCHEEIGADIAAHTHHDPLGEGSSCVACHMPFLRIERGHGYVADHSISVPRPGLELEADRLAADACTTCHTAGPLGSQVAPPRTTAELKAAATAWWPEMRPLADWVRAIAAGRLGKEGGETALLAVLADAQAPRVVRATAMELLRKYAKKVPLAVLARLRDEDSLVRRRAAGVLAELEGDAVRAAFLRALEDTSPAVRIAAARSALAGWQRVRDDPALLEAILPHLRADAREVPEDPLRWYLLGAAADIAGRREEAGSAYGSYIRLDPFAPAIEARVRAIEAELAGEEAGEEKR
ncbi:MAG: cytochrome c3 family protein [Planctomycetota bacterium]